MFRNLLAALLLVVLTGCYQKMAEQPSYRPLSKSEFFQDKRSSRPVIAGTVARGQLQIDSALYEGRDENGELVTEFPFEMTEAVLERGKERYTIFCSVCHGMTGHGDGRIVKRGFTPPPNYITDDARAFKILGKKVKLIEAPVGHFFEVITKGYGAMGAHASQVPVKDRWAIAGYIRALQYSQSEELRTMLKQAEKGGKK